jgi:hypothetical protein
MAFGDADRKFWEIDLTTRAGAMGAAHQGSLACFVFCGMAVLGILLLGGTAGFDTLEGISIAIGAGLEFVVALIAGLRLRAGKGAFWTMVVAALAALELAAKVVAISIGGVIITGAVLIMMIQGIRGALALKKGFGFEDDDIEVFN